MQEAVRRRRAGRRPGEAPAPARLRRRATPRRARPRGAGRSRAPRPRAARRPAGETTTVAVVDLGDARRETVADRAVLRRRQLDARRTASTSTAGPSTSWTISTRRKACGWASRCSAADVDRVAAHVLALLLEDADHVHRGAAAEGDGQHLDRAGSPCRRSRRPSRLEAGAGPRREAEPAGRGRTSAVLVVMGCPILAGARGSGAILPDAGRSWAPTLGGPRTARGRGARRGRRARAARACVPRSTIRPRS